MARPDNHGIRDIAIHYRAQVWPGMPESHSHHQVELFYCLSDGVLCLIADRVHTVNSHDVVVFGVETLHRTIIPDGLFYKRYTVTFDPWALMRTLPHARALADLFAFSSRIIRLTGAQDQERFCAMVEAMQAHSEAAGEFQFLHLTNDLLGVLLFLAEHEPAGVKASEYRNPQYLLIQPVLGFLSENYSEKITLDRLCAHFYMSRAKLTRAFRSVTGLSVGEYLTQLRVARAKQMLLSGSGTLEVAQCCGFGHVSHFIRSFKAETGLPPKRYAAQSGMASTGPSG